MDDRGATQLASKESCEESSGINGSMQGIDRDLLWISMAAERGSRVEVCGWALVVDLDLEDIFSRCSAGGCHRPK